MTVNKLPASLFSVLLAACTTTQYSAPPEGRELSRFILVMREHPNGQVSYTWQRAEEFDLSRYTASSASEGMDRRIVFTAGRTRDCHAEYLECIDECMSRPLPRGYGHITAGRGLGGKMEYCQDWLKRNHRSVLAGSVVVIAGVTFVVVSAGAGLVILAPAVLLASVGHSGSEPYMAGGTQ